MLLKAEMEQVAFVVISYLAFVHSIQAPTLGAVPDLYQVLEDGSVIQQRYSSIIKRHWKTQVKLKRLEVLSNDLSFNLPFATCVNERRTRKLAHVDKGEQKSRFEEISQVRCFVEFSYLSFSGIVFRRNVRHCCEAGREAAERILKGYHFTPHVMTSKGREMSSSLTDCVSKSNRHAL